MARGTAFAEANARLGPPRGMTEQEVHTLPVRRSTGLDGAACVSCWRLDADELAEIQRTGVVWLSVMGSTHPPLLVTGRKADVI